MSTFFSVVCIANRIVGYWWYKAAQVHIPRCGVVFNEQLVLCSACAKVQNGDFRGDIRESSKMWTWTTLHPCLLTTYTFHSVAFNFKQWFRRAISYPIHFVDLLGFGLTVNVDIWPCPIPFDFDDFSAPGWELESRNAILEALALVTTQTNWQFVHRTNEADYVLFTRVNSPGSSSFVRCIFRGEVVLRS